MSKKRLLLTLFNSIPKSMEFMVTLITIDYLFRLEMEIYKFTSMTIKQN